MNKEKYSCPEMEIVYFENEDIITDSDPYIDDDGRPYAPTDTF